MGPDWSSALINVPYNIYIYNGDKDILAKSYEAIKKNCDFMESMTTDYTLDYGTGDWCPPFEGPAISKNMGSYKCPTRVSDTAFFYNAARTVVKMADILGYGDDAEYYRNLAEKIRAVSARSSTMPSTIRSWAIVRRQRRQCFISTSARRRSAVRSWIRSSRR